jgi:hypothetical protein
LIQSQSEEIPDSVGIKIGSVKYFAAQAGNDWIGEVWQLASNNIHWRELKNLAIEKHDERGRGHRGR